MYSWEHTLDHMSCCQSFLVGRRCAAMPPGFEGRKVGARPDAFSPRHRAILNRPNVMQWECETPVTMRPALAQIRLCMPSLELVGNNPPPCSQTLEKQGGGYFLRMSIPQNFSRLRRDHDIQGLCYFYQLSTLITSDSAPQAKILRFLDSKMMISIAKSIENRFQISKFSPTNLT